MHIGPDGAYLHVGTKAHPVTAKVFPDLGGGITATAWFTVDYVKSSGTTTVSAGAYVAWSFTKSFKLCDVTGEIAAGGEMTVQMTPSFAFSGSLSASIGVHACGLGFQLSADCTAVYPPMRVHAACSISVDLTIKTVTYDVDVDLP